MRRVLLIFVALATVPRTAWAQGNPLGPEFRLNTYTTNSQHPPSVAADSLGNFVAVWKSYSQDGSSYGVFSQRFDSSGAPLGPEFRVNTYTTGNQGGPGPPPFVGPKIGSDSSGKFVVVWSSLNQDGDSLGIFGQRFASSGTPDGAEFRVNTYTTGSQFRPSVAADPSGNFVVAWQSFGQDGSNDGVFGQRYASSGAPLGPEFRINTHTTNHQAYPSVAADPSGNFVVVWHSLGQDGSANGVFGQRFAGSGAPLGPEFRVNTFTMNPQAAPSVGSDGSGNFIVVWSSLQDGSSYGVFGQRFASSGALLGSEFRVNTYITNQQAFSSVAADSSGSFVVIWHSWDQDGSAYGVFGQRFGSSGPPLGPEFRVNTYTTDYQGIPSVAADSAGNFVVVWTSYTQDGSSGSFGQRYSQIVPVELMHFRAE